MLSTTSSAGGGRTLDTLPTEVKNEIFSYFLLGKNVKYSTKGKQPGHRYKFNTSLMLVNKRLNQDASMYVRSHNQFILIHAKWFAFEIDKGRFLPYVAVGNAAKTFKCPSVEATIKHQSTKCGCTPGSDCSVRHQPVPEKVTRALLIAEDLDIFIRHLKLAYHVWPTLPIYVHSAPGHSPVEWSASPAQTHIDFVWKINKPFHQDLTQAELRERQIRLLDPISKLVNNGQNVKILGAEHDLVSSTVRAMTSRLLSLDAVGWDLYHLIKAEKQYLDQIPNHQTLQQRDLSNAYQYIASLEWLFPDNNESPSTAFVFKADSPGFNAEGVPLAYWFMENGQHDQDTSCWQYNVQILSLDCLLTQTKMALDMKMYNSCKSFIHFCDMILKAGYFAFPDEIWSAVCHYHCFLSLWESGRQKHLGAYAEVMRGLDNILLQDAANGFEDEYVRQDRDRVARIVSREVKICNNDKHNFPGLYRRQRIWNTQVNLDRPEGSGSMSLSPSLSASLAASIIRMADKRITGQEYLDEDEDEREDEGEDEAEHSDDGDLDELEGSDKDGSDEGEDSDENDDSEDDHVSIGVFNPRHSRGESTFPFRVEQRSDGMGVVESEEGVPLALECNAVTNQQDSTFAHSNFSDKIHHTPPSTPNNDTNLQTPTNAKTLLTTYWSMPTTREIFLQREIDTLKRSNQEHANTIATMKKVEEAQKVVINKWMAFDEQNRKKINEQTTQIKRLEKRIAQMKGSKQIQEEILALKAKRAHAERKIEEEIAALKAKRAESGIEADKELQERERELEMAEDSEDEDH
ncbi:hypothetical protein KCU65_g9362, partial [Aureobasidium melanogenum]